MNTLVTFCIVICKKKVGNKPYSDYKMTLNNFKRLHTCKPKKYCFIVCYCLNSVNISLFCTLQYVCDCLQFNFPFDYPPAFVFSCFDWLKKSRFRHLNFEDTKFQDGEQCLSLKNI